MGTRFYSANENAIEFIRGEDKMTVTLSDEKMINTIKRLAKKYPDDVEIVALPSKNGGYLYAHLPLSFLKIQAKGKTPDIPDELREQRRQLMKDIRISPKMNKINSSNDENLGSGEEKV